MRALCVASFLLVACGSGGTGKITGRISVEGGQASGIAVEALGPTPTATATDESGSFTLEGLRDGWYVVRATVSAAEAPTQEAVVHVEASAADKEPALAFKLAKGKVSGKVVFSDMSAAAGLPVSIAGAVARSTVTDAMGAFAIENLPSGAFVLTVEAADTRERRHSVTFTLDGPTASVMLPDLAFTATGRLTGTVKDSTMMPVAGVDVTVPGTSVRATSDGAGAFELVDVPAGLRSVVASRPGAVTLSAKADVTVARGANPLVTLTLTRATPPTGTVTGGVTFFHSGTPELITVSALGSNVSTGVSSLGQYSLDVPAGEWDIVAEAPSYPRLTLGHVTVKEGTTQTLRPAHMTLWRRFPDDPLIGGVGFAGITAPSEGDWFLFETNNAGGAPQWWWLANSKTLSRRLYHTGSSTPAQGSILSRTGQHLAYVAGGATYLINTSTGAQTSFARVPSVHDFSTDETVYFNADVNGLMRYTLAPATRRDFGGNAVVKLTRDRWLVINTVTREQTLVTPTTEHLVFTNVDTSILSPIPYVYTGCTMGTGCTVKFLPPNATQAVTLQGGPYSSFSDFFFSTSQMESSADYAPFYTTALQRLVKLSDGSFVDLPASTNRLDFNETGTRVFYLSGPPGNVNLREEAVPATGTVLPLATFAASVNPQWISANRIVAFDNAPGAGRRVEVRQGTLTSDPNYVVGSGAIIGPFAHWGRSSDMTRAGVVADASVRTLDLPYPGQAGVTASGASEGVGKPGRWGAISENNLAGFKGTFVLDAAKDEVRNLSQLRVNGSFLGVRAWMAAHAFSGESGFMTYTNDQLFVIPEPTLQTAGLSLPRPSGTWLLAVEAVTPPRVVFAEVPFP